jgi:hypothetical protein
MTGPRNHFPGMSSAIDDLREGNRQFAQMAIYWGQSCNELQKRMEPDEILERAAAALWRAENPGMSVFACDVSMKVKYRERVKDDALNQAHLVIDEYYNGDRAWAERWLLRAYEANQKDEAK